MNFKERQIEIWKEEKELHSKTQELLIDLLKSLKPIQLKKISNFQIDEYTFIHKITPDVVVVGEYDLDENHYFKQSIETLSQSTQKQIIDFILSEIINLDLPS